MMKMNKILCLLAAMLFAFGPVYGQKKKKQGKNSKKAMTYAEISVKQGGAWNNRKYEGGSFVNIHNLRVPDQHTDHSYYIRYEGPGWESNKVGYRLYLDWRNAIDIFGKLTGDMILSQVGQDGFDSYHEMCEWGTDILKVGKALGIGSIGRWVEKEVLHFNKVDSTFISVKNSSKKSSVHIKYHGWETAGEKTDLSSVLTIGANNRHTRHTIQTSKAIKGLCTGIVNHGLKPVKKEGASKKWAYIATYGTQTLVPDKLGMAIFYKVSDAESIFDWQHDHLLVFKPTTSEITFYFLGAWEKEKNGIANEQDFYSYLDKLLAHLESKNNI
jgi:hypothetical protein